METLPESNIYIPQNAKVLLARLTEASVELVAQKEDRRADTWDGKSDILHTRADIDAYLDHFPDGVRRPELDAIDHLDPEPLTKALVPHANIGGFVLGQE